MKVITIIARVLLGLIFVVFGSNAFLHFIPMPPLPQGLAGDLRVFFASVTFSWWRGKLGPACFAHRAPCSVAHRSAKSSSTWGFPHPDGASSFPPALVSHYSALFLLWRYRVASGVEKVIKQA
jgi:hypothetical protein